MLISSNVSKTVVALKEEYPELTTYELFSLSLMAERNNFIRRGFVLNGDGDNEYPTGLEAITIAIKDK